MSAELSPDVAKVLLIESRSVASCAVCARLRQLGLETEAIDSRDFHVDQLRRARAQVAIVQVEEADPGPGLEVIETLHADQSRRFTPMLALVSSADSPVVAQALAKGAHGFVDPSHSPAVLATRLESMLELRRMMDKVFRDRAELERKTNALVDEQRVAEKLFTRMASRNVEAPETIRRYVSAHSVFNGDILLTAFTPSGATRVLLGDFTGHGLTAALGGMPLFEAFHAMTAKGFSIPSLVEELNRKLRTVLPTGLFCAALVFEVDPSDLVARVWNGGMHPLLVRGVDGGVRTRVESQQLALGILPSSAFDPAEQVVPIEVGERLLAYSDGVVEAEMGGQRFGSARLEACFGSDLGHDAFVRKLQEDLTDFIGGSKQSDDITIIDLRFDGIPHITATPTRPGATGPGTDWGIEFELGADTLRGHDPVPTLLQAVVDVQGLSERREQLHIILRELFMNSLDHGLLGLDSAWKSTPDGFQRYYLERTKRLLELEEGRIRVALRHHPTKRGGRLTVRVEDSGPGFDMTAARGIGERSGGHAGRGIALVEGLCERVEYRGRGNEVEAVFEWGRDV